MSKRLYRSRTDSTIGGVCGGLGEYFGIDPTFVRIITVLLIFVDGIGLLGYLIAWIVIPHRPLEAATEAVEEPIEKHKEPGEYASWNKYIPGAVLIIVGVFFVVRENFWWWHLERFWPLLLIVVGIFLIFRFNNRDKEKKENSTLLHPQEGTNDSSQV